MGESEMKRFHSSGGQSGFTLLELLIVVCILSILCGLAIARFDIKQTTNAAWSAVQESAYKAAKTALAKALAENPDDPPFLQDLARDIDTKKTIYLTDCTNAVDPSPSTFGGLCLGIDIDGDMLADPTEVFAAAYEQGDCQDVVPAQGVQVCCLERPSFDTNAFFGTIDIYTTF